MDRGLFGESDLTKVNEHLFSGRGIKHMVIDAPVFFTGVDLTALLQIMYVVPQCLLIARERFQVSVLNELFFQDIVDR